MISEAIGCCLSAFMTFEFCVGWYFPCVGIMKSECVPEHIRGSMYNLFRVPLNALVLILLLPRISNESRFAICSCLFSLAVLAPWQKDLKTRTSTRSQATFGLKVDKPPETLTFQARALNDLEPC